MGTDFFPQYWQVWLSRFNIFFRDKTISFRRIRAYSFNFMTLGEGKIIHCSGEVKIESINEGDAGFNQYLSQSIFKTCSISDKVVG